MEKKISLCIEPTEFFKERVSAAMSECQVQTLSITEYYIVSLLGHFMVADNLFNVPTPVKAHTATGTAHTIPLQIEDAKDDQQTLAELLLKAANSPHFGERVRLLKKLGDTSLYVCGFFGDSLNRKLVDIDYYKDMGEVAYSHLSTVVKEDDFQVIYGELSKKFSGVVDVLTKISQEVFIQSNKNILRLYERYLKTGSELAKKQLADMGITPTVDLKADKSFKN